MRNCLFRFKAKFRETTSLFRETRNLFRFVFREIRNETSFAGNPNSHGICTTSSASGSTTFANHMLKPMPETWKAYVYWVYLRKLLLYENFRALFTNRIFFHYIISKPITVDGQEIWLKQ
jgi:hypothetical protein